MSEDCMLLATHATATNDGDTKVLVEEERLTDDSNLSTRAIHQLDNRILERRHRHSSRHRHAAIQDPPKQVQGILRSPDSRRNSSGHHRRTSSLSNSILSSSILSPVFDYFGTAALVSSNKDVASNQKSVRFSLSEDEYGDKSSNADIDMDTARCRLRFLFADANDTPIKTHRRMHARMCMHDIIFGLDINDFHFFSNDEEVYIPTLIVFKPTNHDFSRRQDSPGPPKIPKHDSPHHHRRSRQYSFTV